MSPHSLQWDVRTSLADIATKASVDEDTVRRRLQRFYDTGFVQHWELIVNPSLIGLKGAVVEIATKDSLEKEALLERIKLVDGTRWIFNYYGADLAAIIFYSNNSDLEKKLNGVSSTSAQYNVSDWSVPPCKLKLSDTDWRMIWSLRKDPRKDYSELASELGISIKTVGRRVGRMNDGLAFFLDANLDARKLRGVVPCDLWVWFIDQKHKSEIMSYLLSSLKNVVYTNNQSPEGYFVILCDNVAEVNDIERQVSQIEGVKRARARIQEERFSISGWYDEQIAKKLKQF